jgi:hypothetical protein
VEPIPARGSPPAAAGEAETTAEGITFADVTDALNLLTQAAGDFRTYPQGHPRLVRSLDACATRLNGLVLNRPPLVIAVSREGFLLGKIPIGRRSPRARGLALEFYRRRVARLAIRHGVHSTELQNFLEVLRLSPRQVDATGGAVRILSERGVRHIIVKESTFFMPHGETGVADDPSRPLPVEEEWRRPAEAPPEEAKAAAPEDLTAVLGRLDELLEQADQLMTPEAYDELARQLEELAALVIETGQVEPFLKILEAFLAHEDVAGRKPIAIQERARKGLVRLMMAGGPQFLIDRLCQRGEPYREGILGALAAMGDAVIEPLLHRLAIEEASYPRRMIMEALAWQGARALPFLEAALPDAPPSMAWSLVVVAGEIGGPEAVALIRRALEFPDFQVRAEAVKSLGRIGGPEATALLLSLLKDKREQIRIAAVSALGRVRDRAATAPLLGFVTRRFGWAREQALREAAITSLGLIGAEEAIRPLAKLLRRLGRVRRRVFDELRGPVALAIAAIGTDEAVAVLEAGARTAHPGIRRACEGALRRVKRGAPREDEA